MDALQFNLSRNFGIETIKKIQRTVGVSADGDWGPHTVAGVRKFEAARGLLSDGICGPVTMEKFEAEWAEDDNGFFG
jgi:peptidoglycan hydrolase-like protein with peptidoglycan-binding domain